MPFDDRLLLLNCFYEWYGKLGISQAIQALVVRRRIYAGEVVADGAGGLLDFLGEEAGECHFFDVVFAFPVGGVSNAEQGVLATDVVMVGDGAEFLDEGEAGDVFGDIGFDTGVGEI